MKKRTAPKDQVSRKKRGKITMANNRMMTDKEIVLACELCWGDTPGKCRYCPLKNEPYCDDELKQLALDLIKRNIKN